MQIQTTTRNLFTKLGCAAAVIFSLYAGADCPKGDKVDLKEFILSVQGTYQIESAGGKAPKKEVNTAEVGWEVDEAQASFTLPYCEAEFCSPGYLTLPAAKTELCEEALPDGSLVHTFYLTTDLSPTPKRYRWTESEGKVHFTNFQYKKNTELKHVLIRNKPISQ